MPKSSKTELLKAIPDGEIVYCAQITVNDVTHTLPVDHTPSQWEAFLNAIDTELDDFNLGLVVDGTVWFDSGSWLERWYFDHTEGWILNRGKPIPDECYNQNSET